MSITNIAVFLGEMHQNMSNEEERKFFFAEASLFWPEGFFMYFFLLEQG